MSYDDDELDYQVSNLLESFGLVMLDRLDLIGEDAELEDLIENSTLLDEEKNIVKLNRQARLDAFITRTAIGIAADNNDPLFIKFKKASDMRRAYRDLIMKKYGERSKPIAMKLLNARKNDNYAKEFKKQVPPTQFTNPANKNRNK